MAGHRKQTSDGDGMPLLWLSVAGVVVLGAGIAVGLWIFRAPATDGKDKENTQQTGVKFGSDKKKPSPPPFRESLPSGSGKAGWPSTFRGPSAS